MDPATQPSMQPTPSGGPFNGEPDLTGKTLDDFHLLRRLGQGGMGQVYLAEQVSLKRKVALKILRADLASNSSSLERFKDEALAVARATHANIVQVYSIGECAGLHYMALEYVEGRNLRDHLARKGPPDILQSLSIMRQVAAALQRASELGIIHRDIKPENILLTRKGEVKVADFGLSRCLAPDQRPLHLTESGIAMGTPLYMSPEQVEGRPVDPRTDVYSFGVTCYHMLAGQPPFHGQTAYSVAMQHVQSEPVPLETVRPDLPVELCAIVRKMMVKDPAGRYQSAGELLMDLVRLRETLTGVAAGLQTQPVALESSAVPLAMPSTPSLPAPVRRRRWLPWVVGASILAALAGGAAFAWYRHEARNLPPSSGPISNSSTDVEKKFEAMFSPSPQRREQALQALAELYLNPPPNDPQRIRQGVGYLSELGALYLEQRRLDMAERFFVNLENHATRAYRQLGRVGRGVVLAFQDRPEDSNQIFLGLLHEKKPDATRKEFEAMLRQNPQLHALVVQALDYNALNAPSAFPRDLEPLRRPPRRPEKPPIKGE